MKEQRLPAGWFVGGSLALAATAVLVLLAPGWPEKLLANLRFSRFIGPTEGAAAGSLTLLSAVIVLLWLRLRRADTAVARLWDELESAPEACLTADGRGQVVAANAQAEALFGYGPGELAGLGLDTLLPQLPPAALAAGTETGDDAGRCVTGETAARRKGGGDVAVEFIARPAPNAPGRHLTRLALRDVTRSKQTEEALRARDAHLKLVLEQMPAILWTTDNKLQITSTLGAGLAALNMRPSEIVGLTMLECLGQQNVESTPIAAHLTALRGESLNYELEWKGRTFQVRVDPLRESAGRINGTIGIVMDVTDHKQRVRELRARARQQAAVAELGQRVLAGAATAELMAEAAELVADTLDVEFSAVLELLPEANALRLRAGRGWKTRPGEEVTVAAGKASQAGYCLLHNQAVVSEDLRTETRFRASQFLRDHGVVGGMSAVVYGKQRAFGVLSVHSARPRRYTQDDLHFLQAVANVLATAVQRGQAEEAQARLVAILEATTDLVAVAGKDRRLLYLNRAGRELLGLGAEEDLGRRSLEDLYPEARRKAFVNDALSTALRKGAWNGETALAGKGNAEVPASQVVLAHRASDGSVEFLSTVARDITERQRLESQLRQAQKMEAVGRLAGGIAHDFNNLLCVITGYCDFLLRSLPPGGEPYGNVEEIKKAGERAATLTRQLLAFSRKQVLVPRVLNLNTLVADAEKLLRRVIGEDIELAKALDPALHPVTADPGQLEQLLVNLVVNARDAMPQGGRITLTTKNVRLGATYCREHPEVRPGSYALFAVTDTGCGMSDEVKAHLFEPFFTTKPQGKGTGLGLATVYGVVKQSGGHIEVESRPGAGTTFRVYFPAVREFAVTAEAEQHTTEARGGSETVLLVEDEEGVRSLSCRALREKGYTVLEARDGEEALAACETHAGSIDLLVTDVVMPRLGGSALFHRLRRTRSEIRVLFISGFTDSALLRHGVSSGEVEYLAKPFSPESLVRKVREVLDHRPPPSPARGETGLMATPAGS